MTRALARNLPIGIRAQKNSGGFSVFQGRFAGRFTISLIGKKFVDR
jgi:hypothetical protein